MRKMITAAVILLGVFVLTASSVMAGEGKGIYNNYQWLRDDDGDGIPNCQDPDYVPPQDGTGYGRLGPVEDTGISVDQNQCRDRLGDGSCGDDGCALYEWLHKYLYNYFYSHKWGGNQK